TLSLHGGGKIVERLDSKDEKSRTYSYSILEGPLPVAKYHATIHVAENKDGRSCTVEWSSEFEPSGAPEGDAVKAIRGVYHGSFQRPWRVGGRQRTPARRDAGWDRTPPRRSLPSLPGLTRQSSRSVGRVGVSGISGSPGQARR